MIRYSELTRMLTIHEFWQENCEIASPCVLIGQQPIVDKFPTESIRNYHNDSFRIASCSGLGDVGR